MAPMRRVLIFANPIAGHGRGKRLSAALAGRLQREGYDVRVFLDRPELTPDDAIVGDDIAAAVIMGGDGTLRAVSQRLILSAGMPCPPLLLAPMGTANLMAQHLGVRWSESGAANQMAAALRRRKVLMLDVARTNHGLLHLVAGVGLDAAIIHELDRTRRGPIDKLRYLGPTVRAVVRYRFPAISVEVDGQAICQHQRAMAFIGNIREYGTGFPILPHARPDDGMLDVCVLPTGGYLSAAALFALAAAGQHLRVPGVRYVKGRSVRVVSTEPAPVQIDGEAAQFTPLEVELLPQRIPFIV